MNTFEKIFSVFSIIFAIALITMFSVYPETRQFKLLLPLSLLGVSINIGLMFVVLRDIFFRSFAKPTSKYLWIALILLFWPAVIYYLPKHGFKPRSEP